MSVHIDNERFISQAWTEAMRADATLVVLDADNYEYIQVGVRHRQSQTLFRSNMFLTDPGYSLVFMMRST